MKHTPKIAMALAALSTLTLSAPVLAQSGRSNDYQRGEATRATSMRATGLRAGPEQGYPLVRSVARGGTITIHGCLDDRSWCDASFGNDRGWVRGSDFSTRYQGRDESISNLSGSISFGNVTFSFGDYWENYYRQRPFYAERYRWETHYFDNYRSNWGPRQQNSYWGEHRITGYMLRQSVLRAGPDSDYPALRRIARSAQVSVHGCLRDWSWCDVDYRGDRGWVQGRDISATYQGRRRSINTVAPYLGLGILSFSFGIYWDNNYRNRSFYRERDTWQRRYEQNYRPSWGPRQDDGGTRDAPRGDSPTRDGSGQTHNPVVVPVTPQVRDHAPAPVRPTVQKRAPVKVKPQVRRNVPAQVQPQVQQRTRVQQPQRQQVPAVKAQGKPEPKQDRDKKSKRPG